MDEVSGDRRLSEQGRALGSPTRYAIFRFVEQAADPVGVAAITAHVGLNHNAVRQHLAKLREAGLVIEEVRRDGAPGRPALTYRAAPGAAGRWEGVSPYQRLALLLIEVGRGETPVEVGRRAGRELSRQADPSTDPVELVETVARRLGFEPHAEPRPGGVDIVLGRCPFVAAAEMSPEIVCELHRAMAEGLIEGVGGGPLVEGLEIHPAALAGCRIRIATDHAAV